MPDEELIQLDDQGNTGLQDNRQKDPAGAMFGSLIRNNREIKRDRAIALIRDSKAIYRRKVEDYKLRIEQLLAEREASLDLSPSNAGNLVPARNFDAEVFTTDDDKRGIEIHQLTIKYDLAKARYEYLYGEQFVL